MTIRVIHGRDRPPIDLSESSTTGPEQFSEPEDISSPEDIRGEEAPGSTPAQPQREDAAENSREPIAPPALRVTVQEAARILETGADALLEAKYEVIADLRDGGGSIKEQHHCKCRSQEADVK